MDKIAPHSRRKSQWKAEAGAAATAEVKKRKTCESKDDNNHDDDHDDAGEEATVICYLFSFYHAMCTEPKIWSVPRLSVE